MSLSHLLPVLLLLASPEFGDHPIEAELTRCLNSAEGSTTHGSRRCIRSATAAWDRELNRVYRELMAELDERQQAKLRDAQRKWVAFRDSEIDAVGTIYGSLDGSMFLVMQSEAVSALTRDRVRQLDARLDAVRVARQ